MDMMFSTAVSGFVIGVLVSAPMGPIGMLCIQRTLNKGRLSGLVTGFGASLSDLFYALLTGLGMSFVIDFVESNQDILQIIGSFVLVGFGVFLYKQNPLKNMHKPSGVKRSYTQDFLTAFILTISNPLILFLFIGLFARLNIFVADSRLGDYIVGYMMIVVGAATWWLGITYVINKLRNKFTVRHLWAINRIIGVVIIVMSMVGLFYAISSILPKLGVQLPPVVQGALSATRPM